MKSNLLHRLVALFLVPCLAAEQPTAAMRSAQCVPRFALRPIPLNSEAGTVPCWGRVTHYEPSVFASQALAQPVIANRNRMLHVSATLGALTLAAGVLLLWHAHPLTLARWIEHAGHVRHNPHVWIAFLKWNTLLSGGPLAMARWRGFFGSGEPDNPVARLQKLHSSDNAEPNEVSALLQAIRWNQLPPKKAGELLAATFRMKFLTSENQFSVYARVLHALATLGLQSPLETAWREALSEQPSNCVKLALRVISTSFREGKPLVSPYFLGLVLPTVQREHGSDSEVLAQISGLLTPENPSRNPAFGGQTLFTKFVRRGTQATQSIPADTVEEIARMREQAERVVQESRKFRNPLRQVSSEIYELVPVGYNDRLTISLQPRSWCITLIELDKGKLIEMTWSADSGKLRIRVQGPGKPGNTSTYEATIDAPQGAVKSLALTETVSSLKINKLVISLADDLTPSLATSGVPREIRSSASLLACEIKNIPVQGDPNSSRGTGGKRPGGHLGRSWMIIGWLVLAMLSHMARSAPFQAPQETRPPAAQTAQQNLNLSPLALRMRAWILSWKSTAVDSPGGLKTRKSQQDKLFDELEDHDASARAALRELSRDPGLRDMALEMLGTMEKSDVFAVHQDAQIAMRDLENLKLSTSPPPPSPQTPVLEPAVKPTVTAPTPPTVPPKTKGVEQKEIEKEKQKPGDMGYSAKDIWLISGGIFILLILIVLSQIFSSRVKPEHRQRAYLGDEELETQFPYGTNFPDDPERRKLSIEGTDKEEIRRALQVVIRTIPPGGTLVFMSGVSDLMRGILHEFGFEEIQGPAHALTERIGSVKVFRTRAA